MKEEPEPLPDNYNPFLHILVQSLLSKNPEDRPTI